MAGSSFRVLDRSRARSASRPEVRAGGGIGGTWPRRRALLGALLLSILAHAGHADAALSAASLMRPGDPVLGNPRGDVTILDFYDLRCPPCREMDARIAKLLASDPDVRYVPVDYPILGPASALGAQALFAAQMQGRYRELRLLLLAEAAAPTLNSLNADAQKLHLDVPRFMRDMKGGAVAARIKNNLARGQDIHVQGIPAFYVNTIFVPGALSYADLVSVVAMARSRGS